jgi:protein phosphatase 2C
VQPNRADEKARIEAAGGRVVFNNGHRVRGILAMSRALGTILSTKIMSESLSTI